MSYQKDINLRKAGVEAVVSVVLVLAYLFAVLAAIYVSGTGAFLQAFMINGGLHGHLFSLSDMICFGLGLLTFRAIINLILDMSASMASLLIGSAFGSRCAAPSLIATSKERSIV